MDSKALTAGSFGMAAIVWSILCIVKVSWVYEMPEKSLKIQGFIGSRMLGIQSAALTDFFTLDYCGQGKF
jgi:hypothetical protein